jgi:thiamine pyrophosphate-dependent acetolactate synthase large subunit-like protein
MCLTTAAAAAVAAAGVCQVSTCKMGTGAFQECPTEAIYRPITKGAYTVTAAEKVGRQYADLQGVKDMSCNSHVHILKVS